MKNIGKKIAVLVVCFLFAVTFCTILSQSASAAAGFPKGVTIGTGSAGGTNEIIGATAAELWKAAIPSVAFTAIPTSGSQANVSLLQIGEVEVSAVTAEGAVAGIAGEAPFSEKYEGIRAMFALFPNTFQIWANKDAGIKDFSDLESKRFCFGMPGGGPYQVTLGMMKVFGMSEESVKAKGGRIAQLAWGEAVNALADGNLDAVIWTTSYPAAAIVNASMSKEFELVQVDRAKLDEFVTTNRGWVKQIIPAGTYKGQAEDVETIATYNLYAVDTSLSEELVYQMTRTLCENLDALSKSHSMMSKVNKNTVGVGMAIPLHEGAKRYYDEVGIRYDD